MLIKSQQSWKQSNDVMMHFFPQLLGVQLSTLFGDLHWLKDTASPSIKLPSGAAHSQRLTNVVT